MILKWYKNFVNSTLWEHSMEKREILFHLKNFVKSTI